MIARKLERCGYDDRTFFTLTLNDMTKNEIHPVLGKAIQGMNVSREFKAMAKVNRFRTIQDILKYSLYDLPSKKESGYRMLRELLLILEENGLEKLIEDC